MEVEFSSASVIINLQTWVLLLDYLGIGIPTPPPSPTSSLLVLEEEEEETQQQQQQQQQQTQQQHYHQQQHELLMTTDQPADGVQGTSSVPASLPISGLEQSVSGDMRHTVSHPNTTDPHLPHSTALSATSPEGSLYTSAWSNPLHSPCDNTSSRLPSLSGETPDEKPGSVWGVEGKLSFDISLNVHSLTVTFNKPEHPLAQGVVSSLAARVEGRRGNVQLSGSLGQASVVDLTETGAYYRERYVEIL